MRGEFGAVERMARVRTWSNEPSKDEYHGRGKWKKPEARQALKGRMLAQNLKVQRINMDGNAEATGKAQYEN